MLSVAKGFCSRDKTNPEEEIGGGDAHRQAGVKILLEPVSEVIPEKIREQK